MSPSREDVAGTIAPLRFIFWGGLLCLLDFSFSSKVNGEGFKFDILSGFLGPAGLLLLPVFCVPLIHLFMSTSRTRREAETSS